MDLSRYIGLKSVSSTVSSETLGSSKRILLLPLGSQSVYGLAGDMGASTLSHVYVSSTMTTSVILNLACAYTIRLQQQFKALDAKHDQDPSDTDGSWLLVVV